jgi:hypothetical protein
MKGYLLALFILAFVSTQFAQKWQLETTYSLSDSTQHWAIDEWAQLYQWKENAISVQNTQTDQLLQESFKNFGEISGLYPLNGLRILIFSEEQQMIGLLDNTLQMKGETINLSDYGFSYVSAVAKSSRPDFIWLFDQYRSRLILFNLNTRSSTQVLDNAFGKVFNPQIRQLFEYQNELYSLLNDGQLFHFDLNLTQIEQVKFGPEMTLFTDKNQLWMANTFELKNIASPLNGLTQDFPSGEHHLQQVFNGLYYFQRGEKIYVYQLKM